MNECSWGNNEGGKEEEGRGWRWSTTLRENKGTVGDNSGFDAWKYVVYTPVVS